MSGSRTLACPHCHETFAEDEATEVSKAVADIHKASTTVFGDILKGLQAGGLTKAQATAAVGGNASLDYESAQRLGNLHRQEMQARLGLGRE